MHERKSSQNLAPKYLNVNLYNTVYNLQSLLYLDVYKCFASKYL